MRRTLILLLAVLLIPVTTAQSAQEAQVPPESQYKSSLSWRDMGEPIITQQGPFTSIAYRIPEHQLAMLRATEGFGIDDEGENFEPDVSLTKVYPLTVGSSILIPSFSNGITQTDVEPLSFTPYYYFWIAVNFSDNPLTKRTILRLKGPGLGFNTQGNITYAARTVTLMYSQELPVMFDGIYLLDVKISGRPKVKSYLCFGC